VTQETLKKSGNYSSHKHRAAQRQAEQSRAGREIGPLPAVQDPARKAAAEKSLQIFVDTYFRDTFPLEWSADHKDLIEKIQRVIERRQFAAVSYMRGFGKTSILERALLWATLYGLADYVVMIGATKPRAVDNLNTIRRELELNDLLFADFPAAAHPIRALDGIKNKAGGQLLDGKQTRIVWTESRLVLPTVEGAKSSNAVIGVAGLTGAEIRGSKYLNARLEVVRPQVVLIDDPETRESAHSLFQTAQRESLITNDVRGMAGPGKPISLLAAVTIIAPGCLADRLTDRAIHPEWRGERHPFLKTWPDRMDLWETFGGILTDDLLADGDGSSATKFYRSHRDEMDAGASVSWPDRYDPGEISALQHAMTAFLVDPDYFFSEYQAAPNRAEDGESEDLLSPGDVAAKCNSQKRGVAPLSTQYLTAFVDCHQRLLYWTVCAWTDRFSGAVIDYGVFPDQKSKHFSLREARPTLSQKFQRAGVEGALYQGLQALAAHLNRPWLREDNTPLTIDRCLIDRGWKSEVVNRFCRENPWAALTPANGFGLTAKKRPMAEWAKKSGERVGPHWRLRTDAAERVRYILHDANYWKSFVHSRLAVSIGDPGSLSLFAARPSTHRLFSEHLRAEARTRVEASGRIVDEWDLRPAAPDNHYFDCLVGCHVAASLLGISLEGDEQRKPRGRRLKLSEMRRRKRERGA